MKALLMIAMLAAAAHGQTFSPSAGTYAGAQTVTIMPPVGKSCFYTVDGSTPSLAGKLYASPIAVSATQTIKTICAQVGVVVQNSETSSANWKCVTNSGLTYGSLNCEAGGGVGTNDPSSMAWTWGTPMVETMSTIASTGETQALFINTQSSAACPNCTQLTEDKVVQPDQGPACLANHEMDANINNLATYNQFHTASLQCNQQPGINQWQFDNQQGSWQNFSPAIIYGCPMSTTQQTEIRYSMHWANGDTSCAGGLSTDHYDALTICVGGTNGVGGACQDFAINRTLCGYAEPDWTQSMVIQDQPDATNTVECGANPVTNTRRVWNNNATASYYGTSVTQSATYTIGGVGPSGGAAVPSGTTQFSGQARPGD